MTAVLAEFAPGVDPFVGWVLGGLATTVAVLAVAYVKSNAALLAEKDKNAASAVEREKIVTQRLSENTEWLRVSATLHKA